MRWYYVDGMTPTQLQEKYRLECGVYADRAYLVRWLKVVPEKEQCLGLVLRHIFQQFFVSRWYPAHLHVLGFRLGSSYVSSFHNPEGNIKSIERRLLSSSSSSAATRRYLPTLAVRMCSIGSSAASHLKLSCRCCAGSIWWRLVA